MSITTVGNAYNLRTKLGNVIIIGDPADPVFSPKATLNRWNGECWLKFGFDDSTIESHQKSLQVTADDKVQWSTSLFDFRFYGIEEHDGGLEFEIVLKAKPAQNKFGFQVQTLGLSFYYQPPLNRELNPADFLELSETYARHKNGSERRRAENVVGSYAVYQMSKKGNAHKTGKAFHIYRPKLTDANGKTAWGEFNPDLEGTRVLTITLPQEFLDNAAYPVVVDPTFGYTSVGASTEGAGSTVEGCKFTLAEDGDITGINIHTRYGTANIGVAIYNSAFSKVYDYGSFIPAAVDGWTHFDVDVSLEAGDYWLSWTSGSGSFFVHYDSGASNQMFWKSATSFPDPISPSGYSAYRVSIYATYTAGATVQTVTDSLSLSDSILRNKNLIMGDSVGAADSVKNDKTLRITDAVALMETVKALKTLMITDQIQLAELLDVLRGGILKSVTDAIGLADSVLVNRILALADSITLLDSTSTPSRVLRALDTVGVADSAWVNKVLRISDAVSVAEVVVVGAGGVKKTRLFLVLGDLAVQLTGD